jgi:hypothetical protein
MRFQHERLLNILLLALSLVFANTALAASPPNGASTAKTQKSEKRKQSSKSEKLDVNSASKEELDALPGIGETYAQKIIDGRPYRSKNELVSKGVLPSSIYDNIKDQITARRGAKASASESSGATPSEPSSSNPPTAAKTSKPASTSSSGADSGTTQNASETARTPPEKGMVWVNTSTGVYHKEGDRWYGKTKKGKFMSEADAQKAGYRAAKNGPKE